MIRKINSGVYAIVNITNKKVYIGSTTNFITRKSKHKGLLNKNAHHSERLQKEWNEYGELNFMFEVLERINTDKGKEYLLQREQFYIDKHKSFISNHGYNTLKNVGTVRESKETEATKNLKTLRLNKNISSEQIANMLGITVQTYCAYEKGRINAPTKKIKQIAEILECTVNDLI